MPSEGWAVVVETPARCRRSLDGTRAVVKYDGATPAYFAGAVVYNNTQILAILQGPAWTPPEPPPGPPPEEEDAPPG